MQERFAELLGRLGGGRDVHVLLSLRDDFLLRCSEHAPLAPVFEALTPLRPLDRGRAAAGAGGAGEGGAATGSRTRRWSSEMVAAVEGARGALPLLAFAISRLWERRDRERKLLTRAAYEEIGGVAGALAQHAEATLERIGAERQGDRAGAVPQPGDGARHACGGEREELLSVFPERQAAGEVLRALVDARLLTSFEVEGQEGRAGHHRVEMVHESLLKAWPRLVRWQAQDEEGAVLRDQLRQAAHLWEEKGRHEDLLWTGTSYQEYELWRERYPGALSAVEEAFGRAMVELAGGGGAGDSRRLPRRRGLLGAPWRSASRASRRWRDRAARAEASKLLALGQVEIDRYPTAALAYTTRASRCSDTPEGRLQALRILWKAPPARILPMPDGTSSLNLAFSRNCRWLAATGFEARRRPLLRGRPFRAPADARRSEGAAEGALPRFWRRRGFLVDVGRPGGARLDARRERVPGLRRPTVVVIGHGRGRLHSRPTATGRARARPATVVRATGRGAHPALPGRPGATRAPTLLRALLPHRRAFLVCSPVAEGGDDVTARPRRPARGRHRLYERAARRRAGALHRPGRASGASGRRRIAGSWLAASRLRLHSYSAALFDRTGSRIGWSSGGGPGHPWVWDLDDPPDAELLTLQGEGEISG